MLVLMTWYWDGSGDPSLYFFPESRNPGIDPPVFRLVPRLVEEMALGKKVAVYKIGALDEPPALLATPLKEMGAGQKGEGNG